MSVTHRTGGLSGSGRRDLQQLFPRGEVITTVDAAATTWGVETLEAAKRLAAWADRGWLRRVRRGIYIAVPVEAVDPDRWTVDPWYLAAVVWSPCYVTGWSAANHWSLTDQVFRSVVVATAQRVRRSEQILAGAPYVVHHVADDLLTWGLRPEWRLDRRVLVADPARTVAEMLGSPELGGGVRHVAEIVATYLDDSDGGELIEALTRLGNGAGFKRLGYIVEAVGIPDQHLVEACRANLTQGFAKLDPSGPDTGTRSQDWHLVVNVRVSA